MAIATGLKKVREYVYAKRHLAQKPDEPKDYNWDYSLKNWGHDYSKRSAIPFLMLQEAYRYGPALQKPASAGAVSGSRYSGKRAWNDHSSKVALAYCHLGAGIQAKLNKFRTEQSRIMIFSANGHNAQALCP